MIIAKTTPRPITTDWPKSRKTISNEENKTCNTYNCSSSGSNLSLRGAATRQSSVILSEVKDLIRFFASLRMTMLDCFARNDEYYHMTRYDNILSEHYKTVFN